MKRSSKRDMSRSTLRWGAALLLALLIWGPAVAHETEKKLGSPGFRPSSARADAFVKAVGSVPIAVFSTVVRKRGGSPSSRLIHTQHTPAKLTDSGHSPRQ